MTEPCAYALDSDWDRIPAVLAEWMAEQLGGKGKVFVDRGLAGAPISAQLQEGYEKVLEKYPDIEVIGYYNGEYALGPEQAGVASLLAANPQVDGVLTQGYGTGAMKALQDAGRPIVPVTAFSYNVSGARLRQTEGAKCILGSNPAYLSSEAIKLAVDILDGNKPAERHVLVNGDFLTTDPFKSKLYPDDEHAEDRDRQERLPRPSARPDAADHARTGSRSPPQEAAGSLTSTQRRRPASAARRRRRSDEADMDLQASRPLEALRRHRRPERRAASRRAPARCMRCSARTAPARAPSSRSSPARSGPTPAVSSSTATPYRPGRPRRGAGAPASRRSSRSCR